jgi:hypothetical protein
MSAAVSVDARIHRIEVTGETITAHLVDGRVISVPLAWSWRLSDATPAQRANWELIGDGHGVHWPDVDEDLSAEGMLNGVPARVPRTRVMDRSTPADQVVQPTGRGRRKAKSGKQTAGRRVGRRARGLTAYTVPNENFVLVRVSAKF